MKSLKIQIGPPIKKFLGTALPVNARGIDRLTSFHASELVQLKRDPTKDALLSDICIGTSAAPTFLPAHYFETKGEKTREYNLIDGGVCANNPVSNCMIIQFTRFMVFFRSGDGLLPLVHRSLVVNLFLFL